MKRLVRAFLSLLALCHVVGCADESANEPGLTFNACAPLEIGVARGLTTEQMQGVTDALAMWNRAADTALGSVTSAGAISIGASAASVPPLVPLLFQVAAPPFHGLYDSQAGRIFINADLTAVDPLHITIAHEIGHSFGLSHVSPSVRPSLMNSGNLTIGITPEDVDALAAIWGRCTAVPAQTETKTKTETETKTETN